MNESRSQTSARGNLSPWAVGVAVLVALVAIPLAGWWAFRAYHELVVRSEPATETAVPPQTPKGDEARANWSRDSFAHKSANGLRQTSASSWSIKGGQAFMQVRRQDGGSMEYRFVYPFDDWLPKETIALIRTRWSLNSSDPLVAQLSITPEQLERIKAISPVTDIPVEPADRKRLAALFDDYLAAADKPPAENALVEAVTALDAKYYDRTTQLIEHIATQVRQVFTEEQWAGLSKRFGR